MITGDGRYLVRRAHFLDVGLDWIGAINLSRVLFWILSLLCVCTGGRRFYHPTTRYGKEDENSIILDWKTRWKERRDFITRGSFRGFVWHGLGLSLCMVCPRIIIREVFILKTHHPDKGLAATKIVHDGCMSISYWLNNYTPAIFTYF